MPKDHDPLSGYRPDMNQYEDPETSGYGRSSRFPPGWYIPFILMIAFVSLLAFVLSRYVF